MSSDPYPDVAYEHDEQWAEREASFCNQIAEQLRRSAQSYAARHTGGEYSSHPSLLATAYECSLRAQVWGEVADHLRRPRIIRIEARSRPSTSLDRTDV